MTTENEQWYDKHIAPALLELARQCNERGMSFVASVEYDPGERGDTYNLTDGAGLEMRFLYMLALSGRNIDRFVMSVNRYCNEHGIDTGSSFALRRFAA